MTVSREAASRFVLWRQGLSEPYALPLEAIRAVFAVQTQYAASLGVAVAARSRAVDPDWERRLINDERAVAKGWTLRNTLHAHASEDHALAVSVVGPRTYDRYARWMMRSRGFDVDSLRQLEGSIREALRGGSLTRAELHAAVPALRELPFTGWGADVMGLAARGELILTPSGPGPTRFGLNPHPPVEPSPADMLRRYLFAHGPATAADYRYWTGQFAVGVREAIVAAGETVVAVDTEGQKAYVRTEDLGLLDDLPAPPKVRWLAKFDPIPMGWLDKSRVLDPELRPRVFRKAGQVEATLLLDGRLAGTWRSVRRRDTLQIEVEAWHDLRTKQRQAAETEADRLAVALGAQRAEVAWRAYP